MFRKNKNAMPQRRIAARKRTFIKSFAITACSASTIIIALLIVWNIMLSPPDQREIIAASPDDTDRHTVDEDGFLVVDTTFEDDDGDCPWPTHNAPSWAVDRREYFWTFLIIGLNEGTNANTIMVASYCGVTRQANLVSIPRDIPVHPDRNGRKLSSSYIIGAAAGRGIEGGVAQMQRDVQTIIGFVPDYYVVIDYDAFFQIIDAVDGIEVYVPIRMRYEDPYQNLSIDIQPGLQHMDSETALHFSRFRQANRNTPYPSLRYGDLDRARNQQAVINAVISRLLSVENLNPVRINEFIGIFNESVHTNMSSFTDMPFFANELRHIGGLENLSTYMFDTHGGMVNGVSYQFLTPSAVVELVNRTINPFYGDIAVTDLRIVRP